MLTVVIITFLGLNIWLIIELRRFRIWLEQIDANTKRVQHKLDNEKRLR